jgi:DNA ligase D-like protein (predicted 3'-phosphoesterase)
MQSRCTIAKSGINVAYQPAFRSRALIGGIMENKDSLKQYRARRDFRRSPEPSGGRQKKHTKEPIFVIQKHDARNLHYDFRLEVGRVLKSWAVPKGPSTNPRVKRAAFTTEDHPLDYADFEGTIPAGEYGGGTVMVWDLGTYQNLTEKNGKQVPIEEALTNGHASVWLRGEKMRGGYSLTRVEEGEKERWLLVKMRDEYAVAKRNPVSTEADSALTGRSLAEIEADASRSAAAARGSK